MSAKEKHKGSWLRDFIWDRGQTYNLIKGDSLQDASEYMAELEKERDNLREAALQLNERSRIAEELNEKLGHGNTGYPELMEAKKEIQFLRMKLDQLRARIESSPRVWVFKDSYEAMVSGKRPGCYISTNHVRRVNLSICSAQGPEMQVYAVPVSEPKESDEKVTS